MQELVQPFSPSFALYRGEPTKKFLDFLSNEDLLQNTLSAISMVFSRTDLSLALIRAILPKKKLSCIGGLWLTSYKSQELQMYHKKINEYEDDWGLSPHIDCNSATFDLLKADCSRIAKQQQKEVQDIKKCIETSELLYLRIKMLVVKDITKNSKVNILYENTSHILHATQVLVDLKTMEAYRLESSIAESKNQTQNDILESIIDNGIKRGLEELLKRPVRVISFNEDSCPRFSIQGDSDLCQTWVFYLLILYIINQPISRRELYQTLLDMGQRERDRLILRFIFYLYNGSKYIRTYKSSNTISKKTIPKPF